MSGFSPLRKGSHFQLALIALLGPLIWVVILVCVAIATSHSDAIQFALAVAGASFLVSAVLLVIQRVFRARRERKGPP
jgi:membrane protein implicated in regulation of membrane protease activity